MRFTTLMNEKTYINLLIDINNNIFTPIKLFRSKNVA